MDEERSGCSGSNLIILSPEKLAKLGIDVLLSNKKTENSTNVKSSVSNSKKDKHTRRRISKSNSGTSFPIHDSNLDEHVSSKSPKGRTRKGKDLSKQYPSKPISKNEKKIIFKKPAVNILTEYLTKKGSANLDVRKVEGDLNHSEKNEVVLKESMKKNCYTKCISTSYEKSTSEGESDINSGESSSSSLTKTDKIKMLSNAPVSFTQNKINNMLPSNEMISSALTGTFEEKQSDHSKIFKGAMQLQQTIVDNTPQEEDCTTDRYPNEQKSKYRVSKSNSELGNNSVSETEVMENKSFTEKSAAIGNLNKKESICKPLDQVDKKITTESEKSVVKNGRQKNKELKKKRTAFVPKIVEQSTLNTETNINKTVNRSYTEEQSCTSIETSSVLIHTIVTEYIEDIVEETKPNGKMVHRIPPSIISRKQAIEVGKLNMNLTTEVKILDECSNISSSASMRREPLDYKMDSCNTEEIEAESYIDKFVKEKSPIQSGDIGKTASNQEQQEYSSSSISNSKTKKQTTSTGFYTSNISNKKTMNQSIETPNSINTSTPIIKQGRKRKNNDQSPKLELSSRERKHRKVKNNDNDNKKEVEISLINMELKETDSSTTKNEEILNTTDDKINASDIEGKMEISSCSKTPTPRNKRGRKSKTSTDDKINASSDIEDKKEISNCSITPTPLKTRGRKRKIVDYSEHKETPESNSTTENPSIQSDSINESNSIETEADNLDSDAKSSSKSKYTFHGQTSVMMNSIFSAAFKSSNEISAEENLEVATPVTQKSKRGRPRTNESLMLLDDENKAFCVICETKVPHTNWEKHNQSKHYNLAWCTGQCSLAIDDDKFVKKVLKFHPKKKIQLKCFKCDQLSTTVPSYIVHLEECRGILVEGKVVCAVCDVKMNREEWINHKLKHNNLAWRIGDVPLDLNDQNLVLSILNALYKAKKPLTCEKCGITKKSVVGYISHRSQCGGEEAQIECEICFKKILPVSMQSHMKGSHGPKTQKSVDIDVSTEGPRKKRRAATNALSMLEQLNDDGGMPYFLLQMDLKEHSLVLPLLENELKEHKILSCKYRNCEFKVDDTKSLLDHMANCELKPNEYYTCTKCLSALSQEEKKDHLKKCHEVTGSDDEYAPFDPSDDENENQQRSKRKPKTSKTVTGVTKEISVRTMPRCVMNCRRQISPNSLVFPKAFKYTLEFCQLNYDNPNLFNNLRYTDSDWCLLNEELLDEYLPKITKSCRVAWKKAKNENGILGEEPTFKELEIFEHVEEDNTTTIFCGGPISSLAWLPTPYQTENCTQILAVATYKDYDEKYSSFKYYNEPSVIQFWNFGKLRNKMKLPEPKLHFCLAVDFGPIWNMEWCPSGCFDAHRNGILAVAGSLPSVYIYAIPVLGDDQTELIYKVKPLLKLQLVLEIGMMKRETYPSKVSWGKARGHQHLAVGYTDGSVGIFDIETDSHLLKFKDKEGIDVILPYKIIKAHKHCITALTLIHLSGGSRWLFTGSFDRNLSVWDLTNDSAYTTTSKRVVSDGVWLTNWASFVSASDESGSINAIVHGVVNSYRNYLSEPATMLKSHSTISSISFSDWLNACIQGSSEGEICLYLPAQLLYAFDNSKFSTFSYYLNTTYLFDTTKSAEERIADHKKKQAIGNPVQKSTGNKRGSLADMLERSGNYESHEPLMFKQATDKYGILFCDFTRDTFKDLPNVRNHKSSDFTMMKFTSPDRYPLNAITKISFNPNCYSSLYFAVGYQAGFVRLNYLKFLENDTQVKI